MTANHRHNPADWCIKAEDIKDVPPEGREILETYAGISPQDVVSHAVELRDEAFALYPWPCIGQLRFLRLSLQSYPAYSSVLETLKSDPSAELLDVGSCFGQDVRKLVVDGVNPSQIAALDLVPEFDQLGKQLFRDASKLEYDFYARDVLDDSADWEPLEKRFDVLHITSFLHIWNWDRQVKAAERLAKLAKPKPGTMLLGSGLGSTVGCEWPNLEGDGTNYRHSVESFTRLWDEVGSRTGTKWEVKGEYKKLPASKQNEGQDWADPNMGILTFEIRML